MAIISCNMAILGGGLAGSLIALAMARHRPDLRVLLIERGESLGGEHVWSFFESDVAPAHRDLVEPLIARRWSGYDVHFPGYSRRLGTAYASVTSRQLDEVVRAALPADALLTGAEVRQAAPTGVILADGREIRADAVIDARGAHGLPYMSGGWQKFLGRMLRLAAPHGLDRPVVMDARVAQHDGYRFIYCLPFSPTEVFVEDTYYSGDAALDVASLRERIGDYADGMGWHIESVTYEETGVLPVIAGGDFEAFWNHADWNHPGSLPVARAGVRAALVNPMTSYSFPDAVRFAMHVTALDKLSGESLGRTSHAWAANHWRGGRFYRMLTRMLFGAARPDERRAVLERFYTLPEGLIERFYAGRLTPADKARVLCGKPPVPMGAAMASLAGRGHPLADLDPKGGNR
ncbi:lycopene beta-cyclase CrtY [Novosphingobium sp. ST904]|uniref:lycopene beta-cyclase CrtY n=2 Tax=Novosphingobium sp. ST904 TaxID=1684385 RepID=UPI0006C851DA|nr:lycopene beta-cyclase CrtY [Novosphingobium sp. ST904]KPH65839.1 lycopene cyclase [Novosphingobium sp. ST904]